VSVPGLPTTPRLSRRELQIVAYSAIGLETRQMARRMDLSVDTVKTHIKKLYRKTGARSRAHVVSITYRIGLMDRAMSMIEDDL
jgi:DNA-binding CsgD family transcriptional regulator